MSPADDGLRTSQRHGRVARLQRLPRHLAVLALGEEMSIDAGRDVGVGVAELAGDEDNVKPLADEQAGNDDPGVLEEVASPGLI